MDTKRLPDLVESFASAPHNLLVAILDQSPDCIKMIGLDGRLEYMNRNGQCAMEIEDFPAIAGQHWIALWPAEARQSIEQALCAAARGETAQFEGICPTAKGSPRWWEVRVSPLLSIVGLVNGFVATSRDITDRVQLAAQVEVARAEIERLRSN